MAELTYRDLGANDFDALHRIGSQWSVVRQLGGWPWPPNPAFTRGRCKPFAGEGFVWAVCQQDQLIGTMAVTKGELGYMFAPEVHGRGIATQAAHHAIAKAWADYDWSVLKASVWYDNPASAAVLRKCGFVHWQSRYTRSLARGLPTMVFHYRLTRNDWDRLRTAPQ